jgi:hypothetical protein
VENKEESVCISGFVPVDTGKALGWQETRKTNKPPTTTDRRRKIRIGLGISG